MNSISDTVQLYNTLSTSINDSFDVDQCNDINTLKAKLKEYIKSFNFLYETVIGNSDEWDDDGDFIKYDIIEHYYNDFKNGIKEDDLLKAVNLGCINRCWEEINIEELRDTMNCFSYISKEYDDNGEIIYHINE